jgi:putative nucleotidyltransferase with HDIG domain
MSITKDDLIQKVSDLQVLPIVARKALDTLNKDSCSIEDLNAIIEKDQAIAARILKISNSALYGLRQEVNSLQHAMMILGFKTIKSLILTATTRSIYKKFGITEKMMWDHSVGTGIASKILASKLGAEVEDVAFVGGLMHDLGKVIMNNETPEMFSEVMMNIYNKNAGSIAAEKELYGFDHTEIGAGVVAKWKFAPILIHILGKHHLHTCTLEEVGDDMQKKSVACVNLADRICKILGIGYRNPDDSIALHELPSAEYLGISKDKVDGLLYTVGETYASEKSAFD